MKKLITLGLIVFAFSACGQDVYNVKSVNQRGGVTTAKAESIQQVVNESKPVHVSDTAQWQIELTAKQRAALKELDDRISAIQTEYAKAQEAKSVYLKAIVEGKDVDVKNVIEPLYENGVLSFKEYKPKKP